MVDNQYYRMIDHVTFGLTHYRLGREVWLAGKLGKRGR